MDYYQNEAKYRQELEKLNDQNIEDSVKLLEKRSGKCPNPICPAQQEP